MVEMDRSAVPTQAAMSLGRNNELDSVHLQFKLDFSSGVTSATVQTQQGSAGGHLWRVSCYPRGMGKRNTGRPSHLALYFDLLSSSEADTVAVVDAFVLDKDGESQPLSSYEKRGFVVFQSGETLSPFVWDSFWLPSSRDRFTLVCGIVVLSEPAAPPPSSLGSNLGCLLDSGDGSDVSFSVGGETFPAHKAVLAARSPVFKTELLGPMSESTMPCITLQEMDPQTFRFLLRFIYTDVFPTEDEAAAAAAGSSSSSSSSPSTTSTEVFRNLLAAADRYGMGRLKLACAMEICDGLSTDTVAGTLYFADKHSCPELKGWCLDFLTLEHNFRKAAVTDGYFALGHRSPSLVVEIKERLSLNDERAPVEQVDGRTSLSGKRRR